MIDSYSIGVIGICIVLKFIGHVTYGNVDSLRVRFLFKASFDNSI
jgi:hypothetical protein